VQDGSAPYGNAPTPPDDPWGRTAILVFRSLDHGHTFERPTAIRSRTFDAPKITVGPAGEVIVVTTVGGADTVARPTAGTKEQIGVYRSDDSGRTFRAIAFLGPDALGRNPLSPVVTPDSTVVVAWFDHPTGGDSGFDQTLHASRFLVARSTPHAGFAPPQVAADVARVRQPGVPRLEGDRWPESPYRGRLYLAWNGSDEEIAWNKGDKGRADLSVARSTDGGAHWSAPVHLHSSGGTAVFAAVAAAPDGTVGVMWGEHESNPPHERCWHYYFAASVDGAVSFSTPRALTAERVCADAPVNVSTRYPGWGGTDVVATDWDHGGHYMGLTAGADGVFHPAWTDTRDGLYRVYTAPVRVRR
jgi:hypothetical protein